MIVPPPEPIVLKCACCDLPFATIQRGVLVILSRHHGDRHTNVISAAELLALLAPEPTPIDAAHAVV
jgi:hypothetical protein